MFQAEFALNCATHFYDIALVVFEPRSLRPRTRQVTVHAPPVLVSTFDPSTRGGRVQAQSRLRLLLTDKLHRLERPNDRRYALVHGFPLTAPVVMDIPQISFAPPSPPTNQAVAGMNWRQEAAADFRATLKPPAEYKIDLRR
ncbi:hypothetical protein PoB_000391000 [Plakobranchus ocellatus]|uniref:Uncharacterized protein n=1 Tax=Plakobranchus ocellatus TaxID=259542 RepID=A0AAV3Y2X3_9GAST|nr:hypothetical protein PoB_000391000 [Plakobranchus ocellatus]